MQFSSNALAHQLKYPLIRSKKFFSFLSGLGIKLGESPSFSMSLCSSFVRFFGTHTLMLTSRSPFWYPLTSGSPLFLSRRILPGWVPGSILIFTFVWAGYKIRRISEFFNELLFFFGKIFRNPHIYAYQEVSLPVSIDIGEPFIS